MEYPIDREALCERGFGVSSGRHMAEAAPSAERRRAVDANKQVWEHLPVRLRRDEARRFTRLGRRYDVAAQHERTSDNGTPFAPLPPARAAVPRRLEEQPRRTRRYLR